MTTAPARKVDGLLFDKDGTLFDFHKTWNPWAVGLIRDLAEGCAEPQGRAVGPAERAPEQDLDDQGEYGDRRKDRPPENDQKVTEGPRHPRRQASRIASRRAIFRTMRTESLTSLTLKDFLALRAR